MIAVDTNVIVRLLAGDDPVQGRAVASLFASESIWVAKTVLLETAWVLRSFYKFKDSQIQQAFVSVLGLENVQCEDEASVAAALSLTTQGLDFADALHLTSRPVGSRFVSFDRSLVKRAKRAGVSEVLPVGDSTTKIGIE